MVLLGIDTSYNTLSVALLTDGHHFFIEKQMLRGQGEVLIPLIQELLQKAQLSPKAITHIAVAVGPGSFTGVRIGLATARAFALALNVPVYGVTNLESYTYNMNQKLKVVLDSKRGDYFVQSFDENGIPLDEPHIETEEQLQNASLPIMGDSVEVLSQNITCQTLKQKLPLAVCVCEIAKKRMDNPLPATPLYLRQADVTV